MQVCVGELPDGIFGPKTLRAINGVDGESFALSFTLAKISRYAEICKRNRKLDKFLLGWTNRSLRGVQWA
uniref:Predicted Peptidoglycan domain-containing protein n=1 Tax=Candidatus Kentrum sp. DK TaxID=2126562 RepID=A0A450SYG7_9GAMM|nr:MAG: Predicted Peptidoglycan domain-containing protein [Candidatus Kentron sp. DK]